MLTALPTGHTGACTRHFVVSPAGPRGRCVRQHAVQTVTSPPPPTKKKHADALATQQQLPIQHKRIIVTAPRQYAHKLAALLVEAGGVPLWLPGVAISRLDPTEHVQQLAALDAALLGLEGYTHVAFTSKNGIMAVLERLEGLLGGHTAVVNHIRNSGVQLAALGADGRVLEDYGLQVDVYPLEPSTAGLVAALQQQVAGKKGATQRPPASQPAAAEGGGAAAAGAAGAAATKATAGVQTKAAAAGGGGGEGPPGPLQQEVKVLCPVPLVTGGLIEPPVVPKFLAGLEAAGAVPHRVEAYLTAPGLPGPAWCGAEAALLAEGLVDAIAFSSQAEAQGLCMLVGGRDELVGWVKQYNVLLAAHGPYTAAGVESILGLPVPCVSQSFGSFTGLVKELSQQLAAR